MYFRGREAATPRHPSWRLPGPPLRTASGSVPHASARHGRKTRSPHQQQTLWQRPLWLGWPQLPRTLHQHGGLGELHSHGSVFLLCKPWLTSFNGLQHLHLYDYLMGLLWGLARRVWEQPIQSLAHSRYSIKVRILLKTNKQTKIVCLRITYWRNI